MSDRVPCVVPFCGRTHKPASPGFEWICSRHWPLVDRSLKHLRRRAKRARRWRLAALLWRKAKRQAIERALGVRA